MTPDLARTAVRGDADLRLRPPSRWGPAIPAQRGPAAATRVGRRRRAYSFGAAVGMLACFCLSLTPSLLPRSWVFQGYVSGVAIAIGYAVGALIGWVVRLLGRRHRWEPGGVAWRSLGIVAAAAVPLSLMLAARWDGELRLMMHSAQPPAWQYVAVLAPAVLLGGGLIGLGRLLHLATRWVARLLGRWLHPWPAFVLGAAAVAALTVGTVNGVIIDNLYATANTAFAEVDRQTQPGIAPPRSRLVSGGPGSLTSWASLGNQGRTFVSGGPTVDDLNAFSGGGARQPIRVYAGLAAAPTRREAAAVAVRELERTGAFSRSVLCVATTTGTGWIDGRAAGALEYVMNGDTAIVGMQYSYLPSWLSFLVDQAPAREAGRELFEQVYARWSQLPANDRPRLVVFGESLGAQGGASAFSGLDDLRRRTDGALWVGVPNSSALWQQVTSERDGGSPERLPVYREGRTVRFAASPADLGRPAGPWPRPRVVYLQNASDPAVWWTPDLLFSEPDWLREPRGEDVLTTTRWFPLITFFQVTADLAVSLQVPPGHGHRYGSAPVDAWVAILEPPGWSPEKIARLKALFVK